MLVATFGADNAWAGRRITQEEDRFVLEGFGAISAAQVLAYDAATPLVWSTGGTRAWVRSIAHRESGKRGATAAAPEVSVVAEAPAPTAAPPSATAPPTPAAAAPLAASAAPSSAPSAVVACAAPAAPAPVEPRECVLARAHYVGGQPSLGAPLAGSLRVSAHAIALQGAASDPGVSLALAEVAKISLHGGQVPETAGVAMSAAAGGQAAGRQAGAERTFVVVHLRTKGYEAFAVDGLSPDAVREVLRPVLEERGVRLQGGAPVPRPGRRVDEVERLAVLHADGALSDEDFRARLGPVVTADDDDDGEDVEGLPGPARMPDAARQVALERLNQLRLSGVISDAELSAMRAKLLE